MRFRIILAAILLFESWLLLAGSTRPACELLDESLVEEIVGKAVHVADLHSSGSDAGRRTCTYAGERTTLTLSLIHAESETGARQQFTAELSKRLGAGAPGELLRGVGAEARFHALENAEGGAIVARFGTVIVVLRGTVDQEKLVDLARAVVARM